MFALIEGTVMGVRPLEPRAPRPGQTTPVKIQCEVTVAVDGARGMEMKKLRAPFSTMSDFMKLVESKEKAEFELDINEYDIEGKKGVAYTVREDSK